MTFLTPAMLLGLLLLPAIVALHLRRRSIRVVEVPSLILWEGLAASAGTGGKRWRVEHLVALVLQLAVAAMLVLALARPSGLAGTASTRVYVLDAGILMTATDSAPSRMAVAQSEIAHDIESAPAGTTFTIVAAGPQPQVVVSTTDPATAVQRLHAIVPIAALPDLPRAVNLAASFSPARHARLQLVYARGEAAPATPAWLGAVTRSVVGRSNDNQSIASLSVRCQANAASCDALAVVRNDGGATVKDSVVIDADTVALGRETLTLPARSVNDLSFSVPAAHRRVQLYLTRTDLVAADNIAWAAVPGDHEVRVTVVGEATQVAPIAKALHAVQFAHVTSIAPARFTTGGAQGAGLLVLVGWLPPGPLPAAPSILLVNPPSFPGAPAPTPLSDATVSGIDDASPLLAGMDLASLDVPAAAARKLALPAALDPVVWTANAPLIAAGVLNGSRVAVVAFDPALSNFSRLPAFPVFAGNVARWCVDWFSPVSTPGNRITAEAPAATTSIVVTRAPSLTATADRVPYAADGAGRVSVNISAPGIYTISERGAWGSRSGTAVANVTNGGVAPGPPPVSAPPAVDVDSGSNSTASWWRILGAIAAILLAAEWLVVTFRGDR